jgi:hypothetical protein
MQRRVLIGMASAWMMFGAAPVAVNAAITLVSAERSVTAEASVIADFGQFESVFADENTALSGFGVFDDDAMASAVADALPAPFMTTTTAMTSLITPSVIEASASAFVEWGGFDSGTSGNWRSYSMIDVVFETNALAAFWMNVAPDPYASVISLVNDVTGEVIFAIFDESGVIEGVIQPGRYRFQAMFDATEWVSGDFQTEGSGGRDHYTFRFEIPAPSTMALFAAAVLVAGRRR